MLIMDNEFKKDAYLTVKAKYDLSQEEYTIAKTKSQEEYTIAKIKAQEEYTTARKTSDSFLISYLHALAKTKSARDAYWDITEDEPKEKPEKKNGYYITKYISIDGKQYVIIPNTLKVYDSGDKKFIDDNDFVGKLNKMSIDFDAEDSGEEWDDEE